MARKNKYPAPTRDTYMRNRLVPKNEAQSMYMDALREQPVVFAQGSAGTGKTFIATGIAVEMLLSQKVQRIVLTRPVVEAGEKLGFLPGTLEEKIHPYLLPLLDGLNTHLGPQRVQDMLAEGKIEIAPLAYMRGRTFDNCFVLLDEAENTTVDQMKLFLTRMGMNTTMAVNGDHTQTDLDKRIENGLTWAVRKLRGRTNFVSVMEFAKSDIVRNPLIGEMLSHLERPDPVAPRGKTHQ